MEEDSPLTRGSMRIVGETEDGRLVWDLNVKALPSRVKVYRELAVMGFREGVHRLRDGTTVAGWVRADAAS